MYKFNFKKICYTFLFAVVVVVVVVVEILVEDIIIINVEILSTV